MEREFNTLIKARNNKFLHILELIRVWNSITPAVLVCLGALLASTISIMVGILAIVFMFLYFGATIINDIFDYEGDRINSPYRPLHMKKITFAEAWALTLLSYIIALALTYAFVPSAMVWVVVVIVMSFLYSAPPFTLKDKILIGVIDLAILTVFMPVFATYTFLQGYMGYDNLLFLSCLTATFVFIAILKDLKDISGDAVTRKRTIAIRFGRKKTSYISTFGTTIFFLLTMYFFFKITENYFAPALIATLFLILIFRIEKGVTKRSNVYLEDSFTQARLAMLVVILTIMAALIVL